ncbi:MAG: translational GTPase TypA [Candidatus Colwellbacteria bacterium]|nr:translational GTPase TypA [Candidatus Colwellbacteria bacterium]
MDIRNVAIIAHVDHGKTTLVDALLKQSENFRLKSDQVSELIMDSNDLERERGITIFSKNAAIEYKGTKINIVDTPGHADFGGEVERIMRMVDGVILLVDAKEGPMPQTKFVLRKAIEAGHKVIVVINKIDKPDARSEWVLNEIYDLFIDLGATDEQVEFPVIYASGVQGKAGAEPDLSAMTDIEPVFKSIIDYIPSPETDDKKPLQALVANIAYDNYKGRMAIARIYSGSLRKGSQIAVIARNGDVRKATVSAISLFAGLGRVDVDVALAGDIAAVSGISDIAIGETISNIENPVALPPIHIDEPTIRMVFGVNTSPFAGKEGEYTTSRNIKERLDKELEADVALRVDLTDTNERWVVSGRGELHLSILVEKMRREGYEFEVSKPQVILKEESGKKMEPVESVSIEVPEEFSGTVIEILGKRLGVMKDMSVDRGMCKLEFSIPTRGLIGIRNVFLTATKGTGIMNALFEGYREYKGEVRSREHGSIVSTATGDTNNFGLTAAQGRGELFMGSGVKVYEGMVIGANAKEGDVYVNVCKTKELTNFRAKDKRLLDQLEVPRKMSLEDAIDYISDDELLEITPKSVRIRKMHLTENDRKKAQRSG